ncbi:MAG: Hsp33 family molecular chaperone HslO, partial [Leptospiraceae bacterium]|nr:Hsp33 family molecular chaperone HslO [Leptospiraceae bacterium]
THTVQEVTRRQALQNHSAVLVAKSMLGSFFLAGMVKENVTVSLQLEGLGPVERVMAYSDRYGKMRGMAKNNAVLTKNDPTLGIGKGYLKVSRWHEIQKIHYSATVLENLSFENNLLNHIYESDQLVSYLSIFIHPESPSLRTRGMFFQALPGASRESIDKLQDRISEINLHVSEIFEGSLTKVLERMEVVLNSKLHLLDRGSPTFYCGCSLEKIQNVVVALGREEAESILQEQGKIEITCEFCKEVYTLDSEDVHLLFLSRTSA